MDTIPTLFVETLAHRMKCPIVVKKATGGWGGWVRTQDVVDVHGPDFVGVHLDHLPFLTDKYTFCLSENWDANVAIQLVLEPIVFGNILEWSGHFMKNLEILLFFFVLLERNLVISGLLLYATSEYPAQLDSVGSGRHEVNGHATISLMKRL